MLALPSTRTASYGISGIARTCGTKDSAQGAARTIRRAPPPLRGLGALRGVRPLGRGP